MSSNFLPDPSQRVADTFGPGRKSTQDFQSNPKLTKQASKASRKPFETLLAYLETFGRWVPLVVVISSNG